LLKPNNIIHNHAHISHMASIQPFDLSNTKFSLFGSTDDDNEPTDSELDPYDDDDANIIDNDVKMVIRQLTELHRFVMLTNKEPRYNAIIKNLIATFPEYLNAKTDAGHTPLMLAALNVQTHSSIETMTILIDAGADIDATCSNDWTALMYATKYSNISSSVEAMKLLLDSGCNPNTYSKGNIWTALMLAVFYINKSSSVDAIKLLLDHKSNTHVLYTNLHDNDGWTALMIAARYRTHDIIKLLLDHGADVTRTLTTGETMIMHALTNPHCDTNILDMLIAAGADIKYTNSDNVVPNALFSSIESSISNIKYVLKHDININDKNLDGNTVLTYLITNDTDNIDDKEDKIKLLLASGIDFKLANNDGKTAYQLADDDIKHMIKECAMNKYIQAIDSCDLVCSICVEEAFLNMKLECGHYFHYSCLSRWLDEATTCPLCVANVF